MAKFNSKKPTSKTVNDAGGVAYQPTDKVELMLITMSFLMSGDSYYTTEKSVENKIRELVARITKVDPLYVLKLAVHARNEMYLRTVPMYLMVEYAKQGSKTKGAYKYVPHIIKRADEPAEALAYYMESTGSRKIPAMLKKGLGDALNRFDEYQLAKYNRDAKVALKDVVFLCHPYPKDSAQQVLYDKIVAGTLETPLTWETAISKNGSSQESWTKIIPEMGYMALLRNLRNFHQNKVDPDMYVPIIEDPKAIKNSKQFPYRFYSAYRELELRGAPVRVLDAVQTAMQTSVHNVPEIPGKTAIFSDNSGSMHSGVSGKSKINLIDIAALFSAISFDVCANSYVGVFGESYAQVPLSTKSTILDNMLKIKNTDVGHSTYGWKAIRNLRTSGLNVDRIFVFSDMQLYNESSYRSSETLNSELTAYRKEINPMCRLYSFDLSVGGMLQVPQGDPLTCNISGYSDSVFKFINMFEADKVNMLKEIESFNLTHDFLGRDLTVKGVKSE